MASSNSCNSGRAEGTETPATHSSNIQVSASSSSLKYRLYPNEVIFPIFHDPWVSEGHLRSKMIAVVFGKCYDSETLKVKPPVVIVPLRTLL